MLRILFLVAFTTVLLLASCVKDIEGDEEFTGAVKASGSPVAVDTEAQPIDADAEEAVDDEAAEDVEGVEAEEEAEAEEMDDEDEGEDVDEDDDEDEDDDADDDDTEEATG